jgi:pyruvate/2-oxoglutarate dehydrogenase complex dihydrolipoamide dehydrogenase (E3) component
MRCMNFSAFHSGHSLCTVNPRRNFSIPLSAPKFETTKKVVVVGGGPSGMEAAIDVAANGHRVTLLEKNKTLGGKLEFADHVVFKEDVRRYREYLIAQVYKNRNIEVILGVEATPELVKGMGPDAVILAIGAENAVPPIPGVDAENVRFPSDVFGHESELGDRIVVIGGGAVGCEMTVHLQSLGKTVDVVEMRDELISDGGLRPEETFYTKFFMTHEYNIDGKNLINVPEIDRVKIHLNAKCTEINSSGVQVESGGGEKRSIKADTVILTTGLQANSKLKEQFNGIADLVTDAGDCRKVGDIQNASSTGYYAALLV